MQVNWDVVVIGGGAAGLMAAMAAGRRGRRVALLEHTAGLGAKILISGGGRCNFTNREVTAAQFVSENPAFARSALARYTPADFIALIERHGIAYYEKTLGQLFCEGAGAAKRVVAMLAAEAQGAGAALHTGVQVGAVARGDGAFALETSLGRLTADSVIIATGGLSIPKLGATDFAYRLAAQFGAPIIPPRPALAPLTFAGADLAFMAPLAGVAFETVAAGGGARFREAALFTHRGLSGPAILQISSYWRPGGEITLDLAPAHDLAAWLLEAKRARPRAKAQTVLSELFPARLAGALLTARLGPAAEANLADLKDAALRTLAAGLKDWRLRPSGDEGYAKAEVTAGGIDTRALDQRTMMLRTTPGLFFVGECVDVTGWLGGYNFQWAWSSGWAAGGAA